jgi:hypothetical protein
LRSPRSGVARRLRQILEVLGIGLDRVRAEPRWLRDVLDADIAGLATCAAPARCDNVRFNAIVIPHGTRHTLGQLFRIREPLVVALIPATETGLCFSGQTLSSPATALSNRSSKQHALGFIPATRKFDQSA